MNTLTIVRIYSSRIEAEIAKGILASHNIASLISADDAGGMYPFPFSGSIKGVQLQINKKDLERAKELLK